jgi:ribose transport system permease protein
MIGFPASGLGNELFYSIAAAVVGGVSLFGGIGTVLGAMIGAILIATVTNGMNIINVNSYWQSLVIGIIILVGVGVDTNRRRFAGLPMFARIGTILRRSPESITEGDK